MKRFLKAICFCCVVALPLVAFAAVYDMSRTGIIAGMQRETKLWLSLPGANAANAATVNENIRAVKYSTGVSLTAVTLNLSTASGAYFLTRSSVDLRPYALISGAQISVAATGTPGTTAVFGGLSAGTGETVGAQLHTSANAASDPNGNEANALTGFAQSGTATVTSDSSSPYAGSYHIKNVAAAQFSGCLSSSIGTAAGRLYQAAFATKVDSGTWIVVIRNPANTVTTKVLASLTASAYQSHTPYWTSAVDNELFRYITDTGSTGTAYLDAVGWKHVLTADLSGVQATSLTNGGINPNSATYVVTVTKP